MATNVTGYVYLDAETFLQFYEEEQVADLLAARPEAGQNPTPLTRAEILASQTLAKFLSASSGKVDTACGVGKKYTPVDLNGLEGTAKSTLEQMVAALTMQRCIRKKWPAAELTDDAKDAEEQLQMLRNGERVFGLEENREAGLPSTTVRTQADIDNENLNSTIASRFFGMRGKEHTRGS